MLSNKRAWIHGLIPAVLIHLSIGSVYSWTVLAGPIAAQIGCSTSQIQFAFSLAIFFLGMSAAFGGSLVETKVKLSAYLSEGCFILGLVLTAISVYYKSIIGVYFGYGVLMGIGLGIGYITPVKTIMMWFPKAKGFAIGCAVTGFGLASSVASPIMRGLLNYASVTEVLLMMSIIYLIMMTVASSLIKKPISYNLIQTSARTMKLSSALINKTFMVLWLVVFINITCGLAVISHATELLGAFQYGERLVIVLVLMGIANGAGRLVFAWVSDKLKRRTMIYILIMSLSVLFMLGAMSNWSFFLISMLIIISATYGAGFSCLPLVISDRFGMKNLSELHGMSLTAWAAAGLVGNQLAELLIVIDPSNKLVYSVLMIMYLIGLILAIKLYNLKQLKSR